MVSDPAQESARLQPSRDGRVRCRSKLSVAGMRPMPSSAVRAALVTSKAEIESEKWGIVVFATLRAMPPTVEHPSGRDQPTESETRQQNQGGKKIEHQPTLDDYHPTVLAQATDVPSHQG